MSFVTIFVEALILLYKANSVNIIFQHMLRLGSLLFFNKRILEF